MKIEMLSNMVKGWFIGNFDPTLYKTNEVEVAVKIYKEGDYESTHYHKIAKEFTAVITGTIEMGGQKIEAGNIAIIEPGEKISFKALTDTTLAVIKIPGVNNDKYSV